MRPSRAGTGRPEFTVQPRREQREILVEEERLRQLAAGRFFNVPDRARGVGSTSLRNASRRSVGGVRSSGTCGAPILKTVGAR